MVIGGVGLLSGLSAKIRSSRPSGDTPGARGELGSPRGADGVELSGAARELGGGPAAMSGAIARLAAGLAEGASRSEAREQLVALENVRSASPELGALGAAAAAMGGPEGELDEQITPQQGPGLLSPSPQRVLHLLGG